MRKRPSPSPPNRSTEQESDLARFAVRAFAFSVIFSAVFAVGLSVSLNTALPDVHSVERLLERFGDRMKAGLEDDRSRLRFAGFLSRNPYVHYRISVLEEQAGRLDRAIEEIEFALGLFELGPLNNPAKEKYLRRLDELRRNKHRTAPPRG